MLLNPVRVRNKIWEKQKYYLFTIEPNINIGEPAESLN